MDSPVLTVGEKTQRLATVGKEVHILFDLILRSHVDDKLEGFSAAAWEYEYQRFTLWANNFGLHHRGHSSLDYRLRESETLIGLFATLLASLKTSLYDLQTVAIQDGYLPSRETTNTTPTEESIVVDEVDEDDSSDDDDTNSRPPAKAILEAIVDTLDSIYRLSTRIRNSKTRLPKLKARLLQQIDQTTGVDLIERMRELDLKHMEELFREYRALPEESAHASVTLDNTPEDRDQLRKPGTLDSDDLVLISRLAQANTFRRQQFAHWRRHHDKLAKETVETLTQVHDLKSKQLIQCGPKTLAGLSRPSTATQLLDHAAIGNDTESTASAQTIIPRAMNPSDEDVEVPAPPKALREVALAPAKLLQEMTLNPPKAPQGATQSKSSFECPYCFIICPAALLQAKAWREHVFRDLRPYICTYANCTSGDQVYDSWRDWTTHERWTHNRIWQCAEHPSVPYATATSYSQHLQEAHDTASFELGLDQLVSMGETAIDDITRPCPFCLHTFRGGQELRNHIATHLQRIALFTLPRALDEDDNSEAGSLSIMANALDQESQNLGSEEERLANRDFDDANETSAQDSAIASVSSSFLNQDALENIPQEDLVERCVTHIDLLQPIPRLDQLEVVSQEGTTSESTRSVYEGLPSFSSASSVSELVSRPATFFCIHKGCDEKTFVSPSTLKKHDLERHCTRKAICSLCHWEGPLKHRHPRSCRGSLSFHLVENPGGYACGWCDNHSQDHARWFKHIVEHQRQGELKSDYMYNHDYKTATGPNGFEEYPPRQSTSDLAAAAVDSFQIGPDYFGIAPRQSTSNLATAASPFQTDPDDFEEHPPRQSISNLATDAGRNHMTLGSFKGRFQTGPDSFEEYSPQQSISNLATAADQFQTAPDRFGEESHRGSSFNIA